MVDGFPGARLLQWMRGAAGDLGLVAGDGIVTGAAAHLLVAVIKLCKLMAAGPGASAASGRYPCCRGFEAWR